MRSTQQPAPGACSECRRSKQRCDKTLPKCTRCTRKVLSCCYSETPQRRENTFLARTPLETGSYVILRGTCGFDLTPKGEYLLLGIALSDRGAVGGDEFNSTPMHRPATWILAAGEVDTLADLDNYFRGIHDWLPILNKEWLTHQCQMLQGDSHCVSDEAAALLLHVHLLTREPCEHPNHGMRSSLYHALRKIFYARLASESNKTVGLLQCGLYLLAYEICHGLMQEAYMTLAPCIRLAQILSFEEGKKSASSSCENADPEREPLRLCWAGLILLDRTLVLSHLQYRLPFSITSNDTFATAAVKSASQDNLHSHDIHKRFFARAQIALYIGKLTVGEQTVNETTIALAEQDLHCLLEDQIMQAGGQKFPVCETVAFLLSALVSLHSAHSSTASESSILSYGRRTASVRSLRNMIFDSCQAETDLLRTVGWTSSSRSCLLGTCCIFGAALGVSFLEANDLQREQIPQLELSLLELGRRWKIADYYLQFVAKLRQNSLEASASECGHERRWCDLKTSKDTFEYRGTK